MGYWELTPVQFEVVIALSFVSTDRSRGRCKWLARVRGEPSVRPDSRVVETSRPFVLALLAGRLGRGHSPGSSAVQRSTDKTQMF